MREESLEEYVRSKARGGKGLSRAVKEAYEEVEAGRIVLVDPDPPRTLAGFLARPEYCMWAYAIALLTGLTLISIALSDSLAVFRYLRYVTGSLFVLFIPGYVLIEALYPEEGSLSPLERLALSIGLSLAVIPLIGLLLNYTPWGIRFAPILAAILVYNSALLSIAVYRKYERVKMLAAGAARAG